MTSALFGSTALSWATAWPMDALVQHHVVQHAQQHGCRDRGAISTAWLTAILRLPVVFGFGEDRAARLR